MHKVNESRFQSFEENFGAGSVPGKIACAPDLDINQRMAKLLLLLQQIDESASMRELPNDELSEMVMSALGLYGFEDPIEARNVIASLLAAIERGGSIAGSIAEDPVSGRPIAEDQPLSLPQARHN
jgi:hypothetical protein